MKKLISLGFIAVVATIITTSVISTHKITHSQIAMADPSEISAKENAIITPEVSGQESKVPVTSPSNMSTTNTITPTKQDNSAEIASLQAQMADLQAQYKTAQNLQSVYQIAYNTASTLANGSVSFNTLSQADTNTVGPGYAELFAPQTTASLIGNARIVVSDLNNKTEVAKQNSDQIYSQLQSVNAEIKSLQ